MHPVKWMPEEKRPGREAGHTTLPRITEVTNEYCADLTIRYLNYFTLLTAVVNTVWSLFGSCRHGQATLYLLQKHLFFGEGGGGVGLRCLLQWNCFC
jgi:hypothetical protein